MLELGKGFAYVGNQFHLDVAGDDFFLDLLFYNTILKSFVIFELKIGDFKPEYAGKLNFYVNTINDKIKDQGHNPTIGVLLCRTPNETVVKFALQGIDTPVGVTEYQLAAALPKELESGMPTIEEIEIEIEIEKEIQELKSPVEKKFENLKERIAKLKKEPIEKPVSAESIQRIHETSIVPLFVELLKRLQEINPLFMNHKYIWTGTPQNDFESFKKLWGQEAFHKNNKEIYFMYQFFGFKKAGIDPFDSYIRIEYWLNPYNYALAIQGENNGLPLIKKLYHQDLTHEEINKFVDETLSKVFRDLDDQLSNIENN